MSTEFYEDICAGTLLFAQPYLNDVFFRRSVILLTEHSDAESVGFILNKPLSFHVSSLTSKLGHASKDFGLSLGGPVGHSSLHFLHTLGPDVVPDSICVGDGLCWSGDFDIISHLVDTGSVSPGQVRFFLGYSGWSAGQLKEEVESGSWGIAKASDYDLMGDTSELWYKIVMNNADYAGWALLGDNHLEARN